LESNSGQFPVDAHHAVARDAGRELALEIPQVRLTPEVTNRLPALESEGALGRPNTNNAVAVSADSWPA
jgi:hypothetical protein